MNWNGKRAIVTGGASFIGSHIVDALIERGAKVKVVDNLTSGHLENLAHQKGNYEFAEADLRDLSTARRVLEGQEHVFHLAADHGGRGYVDLHQAECATNFVLDGVVFMAARQVGVEKVTYASSGCVYPNYLQEDPDENIYLTEDMVKPPYDADNTYGYAKLMAELTLKANYLQYGMQSANCRYFTVYGPRGVENHAVIAMIARAFVGQNPFVVWGNGQQIRNWTYIDDIVSGTILAAEKITDGTAINLGTMERTRVIDAVHEVLRLTKQESTPIELHPEMPTGPVNRVADNSLAKKLLVWEPKTKFMDGLKQTLDWYFATKKRDEVAGYLERMLTER